MNPKPEEQDPVPNTAVSTPEADLVAIQAIEALEAEGNPSSLVEPEPEPVVPTPAADKIQEPTPAAVPVVENKASLTPPVVITSKPKKVSKKLLAVLLILAVLAAGVAAGYFIGQSTQTNDATLSDATLFQN